MPIFPTFLTLEEVLIIHENQINLYGGSHGVRDQGLLDSALAQPQATYDGQFLHQDIIEMAGAYCYHLIENHPFNDGNKRVGIASALVFLEMNDFELNCTEEELERFVLEVASGQRSKHDTNDLIRTYVKAI